MTYVIIVTRDTTVENAAESHLIKAIQTAEEANRAKSTFLAHMSHEIRTPMNAIIGMGLLLKQTPLSPKQSDYATKIEAAARNLMRIINDILDFSRVESGKLELQNEEFNLDEVLATLMALTGPQARQKGLDYRYEIAEGTPRVLLGDSLRLGQVLLNLASNALKFTEKGVVELSVAVAECNDRTVNLNFKIRDTGIGLNGNQLLRIFEPFSQGDASTTRRYGGTGLGLAISKRYVQMMGGALVVESSPGVGSVFCFTACFSRPTPQSRRMKAMRALAAGRRVLVVDADEAGRKQTAVFLERLGFAVSDAGTVAQAREQIAAVKDGLPSGFELVLLFAPGSERASVEAAESIREATDAAGGSPAILLVGVPLPLLDGEGPRKKENFERVAVDGPIDTLLHDAILRALADHSRSHRAKLSGDKLAARDLEALRGAKILLVEDNEINQQVALEILKMAHCEVTVANHGVEALAILFNENPRSHFDAVLMDLQMGDMDGYQATRGIRAHKRFKNLPVIAMTADAVLGVKEACLAAGMNDYLTKPVGRQLLFSTLAKWVMNGRFSSGAQWEAVSAAKTPHGQRAPLKAVVAAPVLPVPLQTQGQVTLRPAVRTGLNIASGLSRVGGNSALLATLLKRFALKYGMIDAEIDAALLVGSREEAVQLLHTFRGVAANLGLEGLSASANDWENKIKQNGDSKRLSDSRAAFAEVLAEAIKAIAGYTPEP